MNNLDTLASYRDKAMFIKHMHPEISGQAARNLDDLIEYFCTQLNLKMSKNPTKVLDIGVSIKPLIPQDYNWMKVVVDLGDVKIIRKTKDSLTIATTISKLEEIKSKLGNEFILKTCRVPN